MKLELLKNLDHWCDLFLLFTSEGKGVECSINVCLLLYIFQFVNKLPASRGESSGRFRVKLNLWIDTHLFFNWAFV